MCNTISSVNHIIDMSRFAANCQPKSSTSRNTSDQGCSKSSGSKPAKAASCEHASVSRQSSVTVQSTQYSRSSGSTSMSKSTSTYTFQQTSGKKSDGGRSSSFCGSQSQQTTRQSTACRTEQRPPQDTGKPAHESNNGGKCGNDRNSGGQSSWTSTQTDNKASIDLGKYQIDLNKCDSSMLLTNKKTGDTTRVWGDPHIDTDGTSAMFNGPLTFNLPDRTKITVGTQAQGSVSYADQLTITNGNRAYTVSGLSQIDSNALSVQSSRNGRELDRATPDGYSLVANRSGTGWIDPLTGRAPTAADFRNA
jgi:hypothetical protein